jgi:hypothetical protein
MNRLLINSRRVEKTGERQQQLGDDPCAEACQSFGKVEPPAWVLWRNTITRAVAKNNPGVSALRMMRAGRAQISLKKPDQPEEGCEPIKLIGGSQARGGLRRMQTVGPRSTSMSCGSLTTAAGRPNLGNQPLYCPVW